MNPNSSYRFKGPPKFLLDHQLPEPASIAKAIRIGATRFTSQASHTRKNHVPGGIKNSPSLEETKCKHGTSLNIIPLLQIL